MSRWQEKQGQVLIEALVSVVVFLSLIMVAHHMVTAGQKTMRKNRFSQVKEAYETSKNR